MKTILTATAFAAALLATATGQAAEVLISTSTDEPHTVLTMPAVGQEAPIRAAYWKGMIASKFDDGVRHATYECVAYYSGTLVESISVCEGKEGVDTFAMRISCTFGTGSCFGTLAGKAGRYAGRTGSFVQTTTDGKNFSQGSWH